MPAPTTPEITKDEITQIKAKLAEIDALLPAAPVLSEAERKKLQQVKGRRLPFIIRALTGAKDAPQAVPPKTDVGAWDTNQADYLAADDVEAELMKRLATVRLFKAVKGASAYGSSRKFYRFVRDNAADYAELKPLLDELSELFEGQGEEEDDDNGGVVATLPPGKK